MLIIIILYAVAFVVIHKTRHLQTKHFTKILKNSYIMLNSLNSILKLIAMHRSICFLMETTQLHRFWKDLFFIKFSKIKGKSNTFSIKKFVSIEFKMIYLHLQLINVDFCLNCACVNYFPDFFFFFW